MSEKDDGEDHTRNFLHDFCTRVRKAVGKTHIGYRTVSMILLVVSVWNRFDNRASSQIQAWGPPMHALPAISEQERWNCS